MILIFQFITPFNIKSAGLRVVSLGTVPTEHVNVGAINETTATTEG